MSSSPQRAVATTPARIRTLGRVAIDVSSPEEDALEGQTKRLAVLVYLAVARPRGPRQRDSVACLFWPELDQSRARAALRGAVHRLRRALGPDALVGRGDEQIGVDPMHVWCDAVALEHASASGDAESALALYEGEFLAGFHVPDAPEFEEWASRERQRFRAIARDAALACARQSSDAGDGAAAVASAHRALEIDPLDESSLRLVLELSAKAGDRARALQAAGDFESRVGSELGAVPSPETRKLVHRLRAGLPVVDTTDGAPDERSSAVTPVADSIASAPHSASEATRPAETGKPSWRSGLAFAVGAGVIIAAAAVFMTRRGSLTDEPRAFEHAIRVYVAQFESVAPNDSSGRILAVMASDWISRGLSSSGGPQLIVETGRAPTRDSALADAARHDAELAIVGRVYRVGSRLAVASDLIRVADRRIVRAHPSVVVPDTSLVAGVDSLRRLAMASVATAVDLPTWARSAVDRHLPSYEAYRAYLAAREADRQRNRPVAAELFRRAIALDTGFTEALRGLIAMRLLVGEWGEADSLLTILEARNRTEPRDVQLNDAVVRARLHTNPETHLRAVQALYAAIGPARTPFRTYEEAVALLSARRVQEAIDLLERNPDAGSARTGIHSYWITLGYAHHMLGDHEEELDVGERGLREFPGNLGVNVVRARAFAALGREVELSRLMDDVTGAPDGPGTWTQGGLFGTAAGEARAHGLPAVALEAHRRALAWYERKAPEERAGESVFFGVSSVLYAAAAWPELATQSELNVARDSMTVMWHGYRGIAAAMRGDTARAEFEDRWLAERSEAQLKRSRSRGRPWIERLAMRARIAVALGRRERGVALLRDALSQGMLIDVDFHIDPMFSAIASDPRVRALTTAR